VNKTLRDDYAVDCQKGVDRWNRLASDVGFELRLPHEAFHRQVGGFAGAHVSPSGDVMPADAWRARADEWLPTPADQAYVASLMHAVTEPGAFAAWIAAPANGIHAKPVDYEYVRL
jgi:benzoyl-CoA 2,3-dioxygenase component B